MQPSEIFRGLFVCMYVNCTMAEYSRYLRKLMDDSVKRPSKVTQRQIAKLTKKERIIFQDWLDAKRVESMAELELKKYQAKLIKK